MARALLQAAAEEERLKRQLILDRRQLRDCSRPLNLPERAFIDNFRLRYGPRNNAPPQSYPPMGPKPMPLLGPGPDVPPGYRDRYEGPHGRPFENVPPGMEPPVPGFEPSPFEKPQFGPPGGPMDRDRIPPPNYREPFRPPFDGPPAAAYRDMPVAPNPNDLPAHLQGQPPRYRDNFRPGPYRDQGPVPPFRDGQPPFREGQTVFRDGQPPFREGQPPFRDGQPYHNREPVPPYRDGPPRDTRGGPPPQFRENSVRGHPYRDGNYRENFREGGSREGGPPPFRPPSVDPREPITANYHEPNFRESFREEPGRDMRPGYRPGSRSRGGSRHNPMLERDRHRERDGRERFNENRDPSDRPERPRDDKRVYDKSRERHEERVRDHDRGREHEKERERDYERTTPDKKHTSPDKKRIREVRERKRSESKGRSRERDGKRERKEERVRDRSSADRSKESKDKKEKVKDRKKKKKEKEKEKEKDSEKKKKKDKKEKKDKDKKEEDDDDKSDTKENERDSDQPEPKNPVSVKVERIKVENLKVEKIEAKETIIKEENIPKNEVVDKPKNDLYGEEEAEAIDKEIIQNYIKTDGNEEMQPQNDIMLNNKTEHSEVDTKEEPFDGIELQVNADELDLKPEEVIAQSKQMLAPLPELSKWEVDEDNIEKTKEPGEISSPEVEGESGKVTTEVIKRAENAIFAKAINSLRPIEIKKISSDRAKLYTDESQPKGSIQITVPVAESEQRSIEIGEKKKRFSKTPPPRLSVKERLGGKVDDVRKPREPRVVHSTVERVKSRSKTPKKDQPYRRVTLEKDKTRKPESKIEVSSKSERRVISSEGIKVDKHRDRSPTKEHRKRDSDKHVKDDIKHQKAEKSETREARTFDKVKTDGERKKSTLDEAQFEPDYDENVESDKEETKDDIPKKREGSPMGLPETKKQKVEPETIKLDLANVKKKPDTDSDSSSSGSSSSSSSDARKKKKKKKKAKKRKKRDASDSDSESGSSSDDHKKKKKKRKHKKKSSKKKKKSKHK